MSRETNSQIDWRLVVLFFMVIWLAVFLIIGLTGEKS